MDTPADLRERVLAAIHEHTGWGEPLRANCEFEDLTLEPVDAGPDGLRVRFRYDFDEDGFSQYDKTHRLEGLALVAEGGPVVLLTLEETHLGVAAVGRVRPLP